MRRGLQARYSIGQNEIATSVNLLDDHKKEELIRRDSEVAQSKRSRVSRNAESTNSVQDVRKASNSPSKEEPLIQAKDQS